MEILLMERGYEKVVDEIGRVCVEFQLLQDTLINAITSLVGDWTVTTILTEKIPCKHLPRVFYNLFDYKYPADDTYEEATKEIWDATAEAMKCEAARNQIIHSVWHLGRKGAVRIKPVMNPKKVRVDIQDVDERALKEITNGLLNVGPVSKH